MPEDLTIEYKYVVQMGGGGQRWMDGDNLRVSVGAFNATALSIKDAWAGDTHEVVTRDATGAKRSLIKSVSSAAPPVDVQSPAAGAAMAEAAEAAEKGAREAAAEAPRPASPPGGKPKSMRDMETVLEEMSEKCLRDLESSVGEAEQALNGGLDPVSKKALVSPPPWAGPPPLDLPPRPRSGPAGAPPPERRSTTSWWPA